ncbi:MAG: M20/M25/M40 family metallo-hydrolase [Candidatus Cloacimonadota bacterium]|nr:M20/M25/M40 family metallo-hydrolase [Candidatus Cloacimonadota bacterium]
MQDLIIDYFMELVKIDSESKQEKQIAMKLQKDLEEMGARVEFDEAHHKTGGEIGNLYAYFDGDIQKSPILFCSHMDTVVPGVGVEPQLKDDRITSGGNTILGSDDKSGIAEAIIAIKELQKSNEKLPPIELLFTISEEIGLLGSRYADYSKLNAEFGYVLDHYYVGEVTIKAPSEKNIRITVHGKEAHAGMAPEQGLSAIRMAAEAILAAPQGRIDQETTCNIGVISGGVATNIVPNKVEVQAEVRSHNQQKMEKTTQDIVNSFKKIVKKNRIGNFEPTVNFKIGQRYRAFQISQDEPIVKLAQRVNKKLGIDVKPSVGGGGSDANNFNEHGIKAAIAGTGMRNVHSTDEYILIEDLVKGKEWVKEIIKEYAKE